VGNEQLWAPWRLSYIKGERGSAADRELKFLPDADPACFLCRAVASADDRENLVVYRSEKTAVVLNRYPYNNGHLLIIPARHKARLQDLEDDEHLGMQQTITRFTEIIERSMNAEGFNVGLNLGRASGAGWPGHLHWHVVPRWTGDTNFMDIIAGIDVIPQSLDALWELLQAEQSK